MLNIKIEDWSAAGDVAKISPGHIIKKPSLLFSRIEDEDIDKQILKLKQDN